MNLAKMCTFALALPNHFPLMQLEPFHCKRTVFVFHQYLEVTADISGTPRDPYVGIIEVKRPDGTTIHNLTAMERYDITAALLAKLQKEKEEYDATVE